MQYIDGKTHIKLLKFTLIAPYLPLFNTKPRLKAGGQFEEFIEMIPSIPMTMLSLICENRKYKKEL